MELERVAPCRTTINKQIFPSLPLHHQSLQGAPATENRFSSNAPRECSASTFAAFGKADIVRSLYIRSNSAQWLTQKSFSHYLQPSPRANNFRAKFHEYPRVTRMKAHLGTDRQAPRMIRAAVHLCLFLPIRAAGVSGSSCSKHCQILEHIEGSQAGCFHQPIAEDRQRPCLRKRSTSAVIRQYHAPATQLVAAQSMPCRYE